MTNITENAKTTIAFPYNWVGMLASPVPCFLQTAAAVAVQATHQHNVGALVLGLTGLWGGVVNIANVQIGNPYDPQSIKKTFRKNLINTCCVLAIGIVSFFASSRFDQAPFKDYAAHQAAVVKQDALRKDFINNCALAGGKISIIDRENVCLRPIGDSKYTMTVFQSKPGAK